MRWLRPETAARALLESATLVGARALDWLDELGSLTPANAPEIIAN